MARIVAVGRGEIGLAESPGGTLELDAEVVRLAAKRGPRVVFLPTATNDDPGYVAIVEEQFGRRLGCDVVPLLLHDRSLRDTDIERAFRSADIVYVGGGNTLRMMKLWRRRAVDRHLVRAPTTAQCSRVSAPARSAGPRTASATLVRSPHPTIPGTTSLSVGLA